MCLSSVNAARALSIALFPFLPESSQKIRIDWDWMVKSTNVSWGDISLLGISPDHLLGDASPIFVKVEESDVEKHKSELGPSEGWKFHEYLQRFMNPSSGVTLKSNSYYTYPKNDFKKLNDSKEIHYRDSWITK